VTSTDATLQAQVNLNEAGGAGAYYQFQLVANSSEYASEILCPPKLPPSTDGCIGTQSASALPIGFIPGNTMQPGVDHTASLDLSSAGVTLQSGSTYHYRVLVARRVQTEDTIEWEAPTVYGPDQTFTTPPAPQAPVIESVSISHLTPTDATLEAAINTEGLTTTYQFQMWSSPCSKHGAGCELLIDIPLPSGLLLGSFVPQSVSLDLNSAGVTLASGEYGFSVRASSKAGETEANGGVFEAPFLAPQSLGISTPSTTNDTGHSGSATTPTGSPGSSSVHGSQLACLCDCALGCHGKTSTPKHLDRAQMLARALKACKRKPKRKRAACVTYLRRQYGATVARKTRP
jgi:hypothetical protein